MTAPLEPTLVWVTQVYYPDQQATSQLLSALTGALTGRGHAEGRAPDDVNDMYNELLGGLTPPVLDTPWRVRVLTGHPSAARRHGADSIQSERLSQREYDYATIERGGLRIDPKRSLIHRALAYLSFLLWLMHKLLWSVSRDHHVVVVTNPPFAPLVVWMCAALRSLWGGEYKYSVLLHDLYPDGLVALGRGRERAWWVRIWRALNRRALGQARHVITLGRDMRARCIYHYGVSEARCTTITNWSPVEWRPEQRVTPRETKLWIQLPSQARRDGVLLVQYSGNMGLWHNMDGLVRAASLTRDAPIHFVMIGEGRRKAAARALADSLELTNMTWLPFQPLDQLTDSLQCAHLSLVSQRAEVLGVMVPSKLYGVLASGRGVIAQVPRGSEVDYTINEHRCGVALSAETPETLAHVLLDLVSRPEEVRRMGERACEAYANHYAFNRAVSNFHDILKESSSS